MSTAGSYEEVTRDLRTAYDRAAEERERTADTTWKVAEREGFLARLEAEGRRRLLEVGAGTGVNGKWFMDHGLEVVATDLSPELVALCRTKGLEAYEMDFLGLDFPEGSFEAAFGMNTLLHVPKADFRAVLESIARVLEPGGLFFLGQYGGVDVEGVMENDHYEPKRFYSRWTDEGLRLAAREVFEEVEFHRVEMEGGRPGWGFQSLTLRRG